MTNNKNIISQPANGISKGEKISADILCMLRSNNLSYGEASSVLNNVQRLLQKAGEMELDILPIAEGLGGKFNADHLVLSSTAIVGGHPK